MTVAMELGDGPPPQRAAGWRCLQRERSTRSTAAYAPGDAAGSPAGARAAGEGSYGRYRAPVPLLSAPMLADAVADAMDTSTAKYLLRAALKKLDEEETREERKKATAHVKAMTELVRRVPRKRKKRRKRRLPRDARISRCGQGFRSRSSFSGAQCSLLLTTGPRCSTSWPVRNRRTVTCSLCARLVFLAILHLALCFLPCLQARDGRHYGRYGPEGFFRHVQGLVCWVLTMSLALCSSWLSQAQDVRHHDRHGPQDSVEVHRCSSWTRSFSCPLVCYEWRHGPDSAENCLAIPQVLLIITVVFIPVVGADVENTFEIPQLQLVDAGLRACPAGSTGAVVE